MITAPAYYYVRIILYHRTWHCQSFVRMPNARVIGWLSSGPALYNAGSRPDVQHISLPITTNKNIQCLQKYINSVWVWVLLLIRVQDNLSCLLYGPGQAVFEHRPRPTIEGDHDVLIEVAYIGVCGSDVSTLYEDMYTLINKAFSRSTSGYMVA